MFMSVPKKSILKAALPLFVLFTAWLTCGKTVIVGGLAGVVLRLLPFPVLILAAKKGLLGKAAVVALAAAYLLAGGVYLLRTNNRTQKSCNIADGVYHAVYETDPGAMGHRTYHYLTYYSLAESDLLTLRLLRSEESFRYDDFIPQPWVKNNGGTES